ncbi:NAD(P)-dependent oxidoreductase [Poseidonocella sp. HB161398]|uniref:NAD(P)-dependent oxidoreductase n=1 Tax=Poseidonocella sp. HB161398 TaxID=2320855 RepID=UPI001108D5B3|nr:NAD(P)-dependent oxidoreductase [Poseidonocella sp. HB161398]
MTCCLIFQPIAERAMDRVHAADVTVISAEAASRMPDAVPGLLADIDVVITRNLGFRGGWMELASNLKVIGAHGGGTSAVDRVHATELGIQVVDTPEANADTVAEQTFALLRGMTKLVSGADAALRPSDYDFRQRTGATDLAGRRLGLRGSGQMARRAVRVGVVFDMEFGVFSHQAMLPELTELDVVELPDLAALCDWAGVLSLHVTSRRKGTHTNAALPSRLGPEGILANRVREVLVNDESLATPLESVTIAGAAIDTFQQEPQSRDTPLLTSPDTVVAAHVCGGSQGAFLANGTAVVSAMLAVLEPRAADNLCNPKAINRAGVPSEHAPPTNSERAGQTCPLPRPARPAFSPTGKPDDKAKFHVPPPGALAPQPPQDLCRRRRGACIRPALRRPRGRDKHADCLDGRRHALSRPDGPLHREQLAGITEPLQRADPI